MSKSQILGKALARRTELELLHNGIYNDPANGDELLDKITAKKDNIEDSVFGVAKSRVPINLGNCDITIGESNGRLYLTIMSKEPPTKMIDGVLMNPIVHLYLDEDQTMSGNEKTGREIVGHDWLGRSDFPTERRTISYVLENETYLDKLAECATNAYKKRDDKIKRDQKRYEEQHKRDNNGR
jgi:hypothetical protein